jgi:hypothetical protein
MKAARTWLAAAAMILVLQAAVTVLAPPVHADAPALQVAPLEYIDTMGAKVKTGYIDVSNPTDAAFNVRSQVRGFRQHGTDGDLEFFDDAALADAVTVGLPSFELGSREAIRIAFTIDPGRLPRGAVYGVIFFHTVPVEQSSASSFVTQSAAVGTLLELNNGAAERPGSIAAFKLPFWQFGSGLTAGTITYQNAGRAADDMGIRPKLSLRVTPWGRPLSVPTGLVLPGSTRQFKIGRPGAYLGLLPITVSEAGTKHHRTAWVLACTGWWRVAFPLLVLISVLLMIKFRRLTFKKKH